MTQVPVSHDITHLLRPESLQGKAYARLSHPLAIAPPSMGRSLGTAAAIVLAITLALTLTPVKGSFRGAGVIAAPKGSHIVRAANTGQVIRIAQEGQVVTPGAVIAVIGQLAQSEGGANPAISISSRIEATRRARESETRLLDEKHRLSMLIATEAETSARDRLTVVEKLTKNQQDLVVESEALYRRVGGTAGYVTRIDALSLAERNTAAKNRLLDMEVEAKRLRQDIVDKQRTRRLLEIEYTREIERLRRQFDAEQGDLIEKSIARNAAVPAAAAGTVATVYKRLGDWVATGDEVALVLEDQTLPSESVHISAGVREDSANKLAIGQLAYVWPYGFHDNDAPLTGTVTRVEQRTRESERLKARQFAGVPGSFVAHIELQNSPRLRVLRQRLRPGAEVEVEIVFESLPLYLSLLPRGIRRE